jgi:hypothetical protein
MKLKLALVAVLTLALSEAAFAAWPAGGATRTIPGLTCTPFGIKIDSTKSDCPFVSDYSSSVDTYWGNYNSGIYADFHISHTDTVYVYGCRQSYTGSAAICAAAGNITNQPAGNYDLGATGFSALTTPAATQWDYFYTEIESFGGYVDKIYGVGYY